MRKIVPDVICNQNLVTVNPYSTALEISKLMKEKKIAAVLVTELENLVGIITEQFETFIEGSPTLAPG